LSAAIYEIKEQYGKDKDGKEIDPVDLIILQVSSDPTLDPDRARVRLREQNQKCVLSTAALTGPASGMAPKDGANYLPFKDGVREKDGWHKYDGEGWVFSYYNELSAPLVGIMSVREARGTLAAAELAAEICTRILLQTNADAGTEKEALQLQVAKTLAESAKQPISSTNSAPTTLSGPHFAHLAMCDHSEDVNKRPPVIPPLGWALSDETRKQFADLLNRCGNEEELQVLEVMLGG
jgi:hypothetical protein